MAMLIIDAKQEKLIQSFISVYEGARLCLVLQTFLIAATSNSSRPEYLPLRISQGTSPDN